VAVGDVRFGGAQRVSQLGEPGRRLQTEAIDVGGSAGGVHAERLIPGTLDDLQVQFADLLVHEPIPLHGGVRGLLGI
jgi:hypothetical protein